MAKITPEQAETYEILHGMLMKTILLLAAVGAFLYVLWYLVQAKTAFEMGKFTALDTILGGTTYGLYKFYFPSKQTSKRKLKTKSDSK